MGIFHLVLVFTLFYKINCDLSCQKKFEDVRLVPKYFDSGTSSNLKVVYEDKSEVNCGNKISLLSIFKPPVVTYNAKQKCKLMSILMFDTDHPFPPHTNMFWFVVNIPATLIKNGYKGQAGKELMPYFRPLLPTGDHRYIFCVFYQNEYIKTCKKYNILDKMGVDPRSLVTQYNLQNAEACNFFYLSALNVPLLDEQPLIKNMDSWKADLNNKDKTKII